ncbi:MAG: hypothetical protein OEX18_13435 [Candidatus Krumholzibacteria bacterium]|nr:hypothetical protein [Candidatus Krumholzibacteria bacterium]MDH4338269.1 hypothetical protein [Candidatus Krumholzibacteria bacterium]MDH5271067.1 hypothetical protein [Candidatus Krumholzibacteria bacterium]
MPTRWLRILFALAVVWAVIPFPLGFADWIVERFAPEGHPLHHILELALGPAIVAAAAVLVAALVRRFAHSFLRLPDSVTLRSLLYHVLAFLPVACMVWFVVFSIISIIIEPPPWKSDNVQYVPIIFFLATSGPLMLTPLGAVVTAWWWLRRRAVRASN